MLDNEVTITGNPMQVLTLEGSRLTIEIADLPNPSCTTITLNGIVDLEGRPLEYVNQVRCAILVGDVTSDGKVNVFDLLGCRNNLNRPVTITNFRSDITVNGAINVFDLLEIKKNLNKTVMCP